MPGKFSLTAALLLAFAASAALPPATSWAGTPTVTATTDNQTALQQAAKDAVGEDASKAAAAIKTLRSAGYAGLDAMLAMEEGASKSAAAIHGLRTAGYAGVPANGREFPAGGSTVWDAPATARARHALDQIAMQKDACFSKLYWYTDLNAAKAQAARENKPILALHLLGKLNEDLTCANSRFFRTTLYPNTAIQTYLRQNFILYWQSERPVPVVTIDFGDGRKLLRTLTGNSIHYILDSKGRLVDALPGLYGPAAFLRELKTAHDQADLVAKMSDHDGTVVMAKFHAAQAQSIHETFLADLKTLKLSPDATLTDDNWAQIAALHKTDAELDAGAQRAMRGKIPAALAMRATMSKSIVEDPLMKIVRNVQGYIGIDTVKNEYLMHEKIAQWLSDPAAIPFPSDTSKFNARVYTELFLTPKSDPWIGLAPPDVYCAIDNGGEQSVAAK